jgi:hypothetical protein
MRDKGTPNPPRTPTVAPWEAAERAERHAMVVERQLAALPTVPHCRRGGYALAVDAAAARAAQISRPTHNPATGKPLIDLSRAPSAMEDAMAKLAR